MTREKFVSYEITNTYSTLNEFTSKTKNVWVVFHGIGYLSRYFLRHFRNLNPEENYLIAPQAQSKYYLTNEYKHVGASWLTREKTEAETENVLNYLDEMYKIENLQNVPHLILLGYSQGVSVVTRWIARRKIKPARLIIHSGKIPAELEPEDFRFLENTKVSLIYGTGDPYLNQDVIHSEEENARELFGECLEILPFDGVHEVNEKIFPDLT